MTVIGEQRAGAAAHFDVASFVEFRVAVREALADARLAQRLSAFARQARAAQLVPPRPTD